MKSMGPVTELLKTKTLNDNPYIDADKKKSSTNMNSRDRAPYHVNVLCGLLGVSNRHSLSLMDRHRCSRNGPARHRMLSRTLFAQIFFIVTLIVFIVGLKWYNAE